MNYQIPLKIIKDIEITLKKTIKKFNQQVKEYNYFEIANKIIES